MPLPKEYIQRMEREMEEIQANLKPMLEGWMTTGEKKEHGPWVDTTQREIKRAQETIARYEEIIRRSRAGEQI
jgi:hypothetical protein